DLRIKLDAIVAAVHGARYCEARPARQRQRPHIGRLVAGPTERSAALVLPPSTIAPGAAISSTPVSASPCVIQSAARLPSGSRVLSPVWFAKGTTRTRLGFSGAGSRVRSLTAATTTASPTNPAATPTHRRRAGPAR